MQVTCICSLRATSVGTVLVYVLKYFSAIFFKLLKILKRALKPSKILSLF